MPSKTIDDMFQSPNDLEGPLQVAGRLNEDVIGIGPLAGRWISRQSRQ